MKTWQEIKAELKSYIPAAKTHAFRLLAGLGIVTLGVNILGGLSWGFLIICLVAYGFGWVYTKLVA